MDLSTLSDAQLQALHSQSGNDLAALSDEQLKAAYAGASNSIAGSAKAIGSGLASAGIGMAGISGDARGMASGLANLAIPGAGAAVDKMLKYAVPGMGGPSSQDVRSAIESQTGSLDYQPQTTLEKYLKTGAEFAPALASPGGIGRKVLQTAVPAIASETAGQLTEGTAAEPYARIAGAMAAPVAGAALSRAITPLPANAARQQAVNALQGEGVAALTAGQRTGSKPLQWFEQAMGDIPGSGRGSARATEQASEQFTQAALRRAGENANRATPDVIDHAFTRIGNQFDTIAARNHIIPDRAFAQELAGVQQDYHFLANPLQRAVVDNAINDVIGVIQRQNGIIPGAQYQAMRSRLDKAARGAVGNDNQLSQAMFGIRNALDDAMERSLQRAGRAGDAADWRTARNQYRNMLVVEKAATGAGENAALGLISPSQLRNATVGQNRRAYARGQGDFADLARSGEAVMRPLPQSGTAPRSYAQHLPAAFASMLGGLFGGVPGAAVAGASAIAGPPIIGRAMMSGPVQRYLGNQLLAGAPNPLPISSGLLGAVLAANGNSRALLPANQ